MENKKQTNEKTKLRMKKYRLNKKLSNCAQENFKLKDGYKKRTKKYRVIIF